MTDLHGALLAAEIEARRADQASGVVPPDVRRSLYPHEITARTNFAEIEGEVDAEAQRVAQRIATDRAAFLALLVEDLHRAATRPGPQPANTQIALRLAEVAGIDGLAAVPGATDLLAEAEAAHLTRLERTVRGAVDRLVAEARAQGVAVDVSLVAKLDPDAQDHLLLLARRLAVAPQLDLAVALRDRVIVEARAFVAPGTLVERLATHARTLSDGPLVDQARQATQQAHGLGRVAGASVLPEPKARYASELLDRATCGPCSMVDGKRYASESALRADYPNGIYARCEGGTRCRGTAVYVWPTEADATLPTAGD